MKSFKIIVEKHDDGYVAYPVGLNGVIIAKAIHMKTPCAM